MMKKKIKLSILCSMLIPLLFSCAQGFDDSPGLELSDVNNTQMVTPADSLITMIESPDGKFMTISWPFAFGAGGYEIEYARLDVNNEKDTIIHEFPTYDGNSIMVAVAEDTKYQFAIRTLGNKEYNNFDALDTTKLLFGTAYEEMMRFKPGDDVTAYFAENPIPLASPFSIKYVFEPGEYTISQVGEEGAETNPLHLGRSSVMFEGYLPGVEEEPGITPAPVVLPKITLDGTGFVSDGAGLKFKNLEFDYNKDNNTKPVFLGFNNADSVFDNYKDNAGFVTVYDPIVFQNCRIDLNSTFIRNTHSGTSNRKKYALATVFVNNCFISYNSGNNFNVFDFNSNGFIKSLLISSSTFWAKANNHGNYFYQPQNIRIAIDNPTNWKWAGGLLISFEYSTFYQVCKTGQMYNHSNISNTGDNANVKNTVSLRYSIFVDTGNKDIWRRLTNSGNSNVQKIADRNTYWYDGALATAELATNYDSSGTHFTTDPLFADAANGNFTVRSLSHKGVAGDPRWW